MASNRMGARFQITTFGESHGPAVGVVIDGVRPGLPLDASLIQAELDRRRPGQSRVTSQRREPDTCRLLSGVFEGRTTGAPIAIVIDNVDAKTGSYTAFQELFRPGHADFTFWKKYGIHDWRGGGRSSGRETAARVAAGAIAKQILREAGVSITGHVVSVGDVEAQTFDAAVIEQNPVRCADPVAAQRMEQAILDARSDRDSIGGVVEVFSDGVPPGWGDPVFEKLTAEVGRALLSIGAVKGVEFGDGFELARRRGSQTNDALEPHGFASNHMGGLLGGISTGQRLVARIAVKPTSSIARPQHTVTRDNEPTQVSVTGRHDPCICPRIVPVAEAMMALALCDAHLRQEALRGAQVAPLQAQHELAWIDQEIVALLERRAAIPLEGVDEDALAALRVQALIEAGLPTAWSRLWDG